MECDGARPVAAAGLFTEIIRYQPRLFVPLGGERRSIISKL